MAIEEKKDLGKDLHQLTGPVPNTKREKRVLPKTPTKTRRRLPKIPENSIVVDKTHPDTSKPTRKLKVLPKTPNLGLGKRQFERLKALLNILAYREYRRIFNPLKETVVNKKETVVNKKESFFTRIFSRIKNFFQSLVRYFRGLLGFSLPKIKRRLPKIQTLRYSNKERRRLPSIPPQAKRPHITPKNAISPFPNTSRKGMFGGGLGSGRNGKKQ